MSTPQNAAGRPAPLRAEYHEDMTPQTATIDPQTALAARQNAYQRALPAWYSHLTVHDLPKAQAQGVITWLNGTRPLLWLGGETFRGKTATGWLLVARYAVETGKTWAVVDVQAYLEAKRGIQTPAEADLIHRAHNVDVLVLDEWPRKMNEGNDIDYLRRLLNTRDGKRTVITGNGAPGVAETLRNHPDPATAVAARSLHNRLTHRNDDGSPGAGDYCPFPDTLPQLRSR